MTSDHWGEVDRIYHEALERGAVDRASYLEGACGGDTALRQEVESLLQYRTAADGFLERPALQDAAERLAHEVNEPLPDSVGGYKILRTLGEGGMGIVYLAEQLAPIRRQVALKVIKHGMDTRQVVARFESERQALALMHHPHIAAVFDAGTSADGRPFFVMEYVDGAPITAYCDRRTLSTRARLELFTAVCGAVQHAHQKGVIHRDLKPSNVLVSDEDGRPTPKIIDFGIAKAIQPSLGPHATFTEQGTLVGTPEYMSPEQAALSPDIDTTTDVYSLGVLLYELLVGALPFDPRVLREKGPDEMRRLIRESDPPKPSARLTNNAVTVTAVAAARQTDAGRLTRQLKGDLDWITLKALEKDRRHRYVTVSAFGADVQRFLDNKPVEARPPSVAYRMRKFTRRYRTAVIAAAAVFVVLVAGLTVSIEQYLRAEANLAEANKERARGDEHLAAANAAAREAAAQRTDAQRANAEANRERTVAERQTEQADAQRVAALAALRDAASEREVADSATAEAKRQSLLAMKEAANASALQRQAEYTAYAATITAVDSELRSNSTGTARAQLLAAPEALRGWEWQHLLLKTDTSVATLTSATPCARPGEAEGTPVTSSDNVVTVRNQGARIYLRRCATLDEWDAPSYAHIAHQADGKILALGPNAAMLVLHNRSGGTWDVQLVDPASKQPTGHAGPFDAQPICADVSADGRRVAIGLQPQVGLNEPLDDMFEVWDLRADRRLARMTPPRPPAPDTRNANPTSCQVAFNPDATQVATSGATVHMWNTLAGSEFVADAGQAGIVSQPIAWNRDGSRLAIGRPTGLVDLLHVSDRGPTEHLDGNNFVPVLPMAGDQQLQAPQRRRAAVLSLAFTDDGQHIITGTDLTVGVWDLSQRKLTHVAPGHAAEVTGVASMPNGRIVSADAGGNVKLWSSSMLGAVTHLPGSVGPAADLAMSRDGAVVAVAQADGGLFAWRLSDLHQTIFHTASGVLHAAGLVQALAFTPDGSRFLAAEYDDVGTVRTWAMDSEHVATRPMRLNERPEPGCDPLPSESAAVLRFNAVDLMALSPDGGSLAFRQGRCVVVKDLATQKTVALREYPTSLTFLPDGALLVVSYPWVATPTGRPGHARIRIWDWRANHVRVETPTPAATDREDPTWRLATCGGSGRIVVTGGRPVVASIWDGALTHELGRLPVPPDTKRVACSADGHRVASTADDFTVRVWDADRLTLLLTLTDEDLHAGGLAFTTDGRLITGRSSGGLTIWQTQKGR